MSLEMMLQKRNEPVEGEGKVSDDELLINTDTAIPWLLPYLYRGECLLG